MPYTSASVAVEAQTKLFHTEKDVECTLILKNKTKHKKRGRTTATSFQFRMFNNKIVNIPLVDGIGILFNACLLTHRQKMMSRGEFPMINVGLHSNQKFGNHFSTLLERLKNWFGDSMKVRASEHLQSEN